MVAEVAAGVEAVDSGEDEVVVGDSGEAAEEVAEADSKNVSDSTKKIKNSRLCCAARLVFISEEMAATATGRYRTNSAACMCAIDIWVVTL